MNARAAFDRLLRLKPHDVSAFAAAFRCASCSADWRTLAGPTCAAWKTTWKKVWLRAGRRPFCRSTPSRSPGRPIRQRAVAEAHAAAMDRRLDEVRQNLAFTHVRGPVQRLRIGYLSADFHNHATAQLMLSLFGLHDRNAFEIIAYSYGPDDGSDYRRRIARDCDRFVDLSGTVPAIGPPHPGRRHPHPARSEGPDRTVAARDSRFLRLSRRTISHPGTTVGTVDRLLPCRPGRSPGRAGRLSAKSWCCCPIATRSTIIASRSPTRSFSVPSAACRKTDLFFAASTTATNSSHGCSTCGCGCSARYREAFSGCSPVMPRWPRTLRREAQARGVAPNRIVVAEPIAKPLHLARYRLAGLFLDTLEYNAHTTASDAALGGPARLELSRRHLRIPGCGEPAVGRGFAGVGRPEPGRIRSPARFAWRRSPTSWPSSKRSSNDNGLPTPCSIRHVSHAIWNAPTGRCGKFTGQASQQDKLLFQRNT